jgi:predicted transcriptional regulator
MNKDSGEIMNIAISIKTKYLNKIREGSKIWELRKSLPRNLLEEGKINKVWVWETAPVSKVVGYFEFYLLFSGKLEDLRKLAFLKIDAEGEKNYKIGDDDFYHNFGITKAEFDAYFKGCENKVVYALLITNWVEQSADFGIKPPQNYVFINKE